MRQILDCSYNGVEGLHIEVTEFVREKECLVCGPGILVELESSITQPKELLMLAPNLLLSKASHIGGQISICRHPVLEEMTRSNLDFSLFDLMGKVSKDIVHVTGISCKGDKKTSSLRKLRVAFMGVIGVITNIRTYANNIIASWQALYPG
ncbi:hypothetical protein MLD38_027350 [Melastoma candidum]|uniref:Uncharacterized protein n=1 Tax=Melastoma candidum TaxID=119954 RepID=A0ACB9P632_9MYRT|nr:hypothetical protein MLD38_027350 [Melastoma candidum]